MIKKVANGKEIDLHDFDYTCVKISQTILDAITHKLRQQILQTINKHKKISVTQLQQQLGLKQTVTSKHLAILRKNGLVKDTRKGAVIE